MTSVFYKKLKGLSSCFNFDENTGLLALGRLVTHFVKMSS